MSAPARPRLLYLVHCYDNLAGVELHTRSLIEGLASRYEVFVAFPREGCIRLLGPDGRTSEFPADPPQWPAAPYHAPRTEQALTRILADLRPDLIHVQHFLHWPLSVIDQAADSGAPVVVSFHDFYAITPLFTMQGTDDPEETFTAAYSQKAFGRDLTAYLAERRRLMTAALGRAKVLVTISPFLERQLGKIFPGPFRVIEYGIKPFAASPPRPPSPTRGEGAGETPFHTRWEGKAPSPTRGEGKAPSPLVGEGGGGGRKLGLRFGCVGSLIPQKGWRSVFDAFPEVRRRHPTAELHFHGGPVPAVPIPEGVTFHGAFRPEDLPRLCAGFDVALIPSVFAETYCLVLSEMWMAGLPVAVSDIGALGDRVVDGVNGKKFHPGDPRSIAEALCWFLEHDDWRRWEIPRPREVGAMLDDYDRLYREILAGSERAATVRERDAEERSLTAAARSGARPDLLVVQICDFFDDGDRFYRFHLPSRRLARLPGVRVIDCHYLHRMLPELAEAADVLVLQFIHDWGLLGLIERRRAAGRATVFEANDYFYDLQPWNPLSIHWRDRAVQEEFRRFLRAADAVQTSTEELARRWRAWSGRVAVFRNQLADVAPLSPPPDRPLTVGWGGSPGHFADWFHVAPLLQQWLDAHPDVHLAVMTGEAARPFFRLPPERYHFAPFGSVEAYYRFLGSLDVGLAPLLPSDYNRCRSDVKFLEYAAVGVAGIYADVAPYRGSVVDGETGLLYRTGPELLACLDRLAGDAALRLRIRAQAHAHVAAHRRMDQHVGERLAFYRGLAPARSGPLAPGIAASALRDGAYWQLLPGEPEQAFMAAMQGPSAPAGARALAALVERHPAYIVALHHLGRVLNDLKNSRAALPYLERARALQPDDAGVLCEIGRARFLLDDLPGARAALQEALTRQPLYYPGWQYLLRLLGLHPSADGPTWAEQARRLFPACYPLALAGVKLVPPAEGVRVLRRILEEQAPSLKTEERTPAALAFGQAIGEATRPLPTAPESLALLRRACEVFPESARLATLLGDALYEAGRAEESHGSLERALRLRHPTRAGGEAADDGTLLYEQMAEHILRWTGVRP